MGRGLVIVEDTENGRVLTAEAAATARGSESELIAVSVMRPESFAEDVETWEAIGDIADAHYDENSVLEAERKVRAGRHR